MTSRFTSSFLNAPLTRSFFSDGQRSQEVSDLIAPIYQLLFIMFSDSYLLDLTTAAEEKVIDRVSDQVDLLREDTKAVDARHHEIVHGHVLIPGYPRIEYMVAHAVARPSIGAALEHLHSRVEDMGQAPTVGGGPPNDDSHLGEMIGYDRLLHPGGLDLLVTMRVGRAICPGAAAAQGGPEIPHQGVKIPEQPDTPLLLPSITIDRCELSHRKASRH